MNIALKVQAADAAAEIAATPLENLNPAQMDRFRNGTHWSVFERLRREDPVHFTRESEFGPYWSITKWNDILAVDTNHEAFSSAEGIIITPLADIEERTRVMGKRPKGDIGFITMDEPDHGPARKAVTPTMAPANLQTMAGQVRERAGQILDSLPIGTEFDWVDLVSKELTAMTLATLFDFPFEQRRKLTHWSDILTSLPGYGPVESWEQKGRETFECFDAFQELWNQRRNDEPRNDLISMLAHNPATRNMSVEAYQGNVILLIVGGNDTTRNTITSSVLELNRNPDQYAKLRANPDLVLSMVSETIRWQAPLAHMARTATRDVEVGGKTIKKGDRVAMWYISGNRDEEMIDRPNEFIIDRERPRQHMSFGFGIHRCVGNRVAEMQLTIIWEQILKRFPEIKVVAEPELNFSSFVHGFESLPVIIPYRT
ncbi:cytochrome P450 [Phenylobacterium sp. Root700]|uniref:cytochrome P450 n=1 Tax=Phenylobacterium sp. Root700 TaxID=1736591 RepID=UPI0006FDAFBA|nr:cytochrome P450 [Phenylobacterium sp. Root700]KRB40984.1 cytochrome [Phenylobacterium sp. Root700]